MLIYTLIFVSKIVENALATLRLIVVANGKKMLGAVLNGIIGIVWIFATSMVIVDINKDLFKIVFFCLGSAVGSYLGSFIEEKIALGSNVLMCIVNEKYEESVKKKLKNYQITTISEKNNKYSILLIFIKRKETRKISSIIKSIDKNSILISEKAKSINNIV